MTTEDLKQICDEQRGRLEYQKKMLNVMLDMMIDTNNTMRYVIERLEEMGGHDYLMQLEKEHKLHGVT